MRESTMWEAGETGTSDAAKGHHPEEGVEGLARATLRRESEREKAKAVGCAGGRMATSASANRVAK